MKLDAATLEPIWVNTILFATMGNTPGGVVTIEDIAVDSTGDVVLAGYSSASEFDLRLSIHD